MKRGVVILAVITLFWPKMPVDANIAKPIRDVLETVITKCKWCKDILSSPAAEKLVKRGIIKMENADDVGKFLARYGDDGLKHLESFGDDALKIYTRYGDDGMSHLKQYGDEYLSLLRRESPESVNSILKHSDGMIFIRESPDFVKNYAKYGDDLIDCVRKNPVCVDSVRRTGLSPKALSGLKDTNVTWAEVRIPELAAKDANAFRNVLTKYGDPAAEFAKKHWQVVSGAGVFALIAADWDKVRAGGIDVVKQMIDKGGDVVGEGVKVVAKESGKVVSSGVKDTTEVLGPYLLFFLILGIVALFLVYRFAKSSMSK